MSDFIASNLHKKVDHLMDVFYGAGVASHPTIIEQINYLLFMRALSQRDDELRLLGATNDNEIVFDGELEKYHWDNLLTLNAEALFTALEECFRKIPGSTTNKTVRLVYRNAHIKLFDKPSLRTVLHEIDEFGKAMDESEHEGKRDVFGDTYEYLLSKLAQAGTSGQFRTPRHIIEFIVNVIAPKKGETIIDPAVGTAGFLVKAYEHLRKEYTSPETLATGGSFDKLNNKEHTFLLEHTFTGFDSDEDMIKFGMMNLYLHGLKDAKLLRQNTLTDTAGTRDKYDIILANPPFAGKIDRDSVAEELQMNTGATEVLFLRYMLRHLTDKGRVGVIVPEGVLFNGSGAHTKIREQLLENGLWCVVSLPAGVFNPYAGVKTSVLFLDKTQKDKHEVLFVKVENDGFSLSAQRKPIKKNDLPEIITDIERYKIGNDIQWPNANVVRYEQIRETKDFNLNGDRYKLVSADMAHDYPMVELGELCEITSSKRVFKSEWTDSGVPFYRAREIVKLAKDGYVNNGLFITEEMFSEYSKKYGSPQEGDLMVTGVGTLGICYLVKRNDRFYFKDGNIIWFKHFTDKVDSRYIKYLFSNTLIKNQIRAFSGGGTVGTYTIVRAKETKIPLPPLDIQQKIITGIENKQMAINHAREIIATLERERAYFDPSTRAARENWPIVKFSDIAKLVRGPFGGSLKKEIFVAEGFKVYEQGDAIHGNHQATRYFVDQKKFDEMSRFKVAPGDLIMSCSGTLGRIAIIDDSSPEGIINQALLKITPNEKIIPGYMKLALESAPMQMVLALNSQGGVINNVVSVKQLAELQIPLPPLVTQKQIVDQFAEEQQITAANRKLINIYEQKIAQTLAEI